MSERPKRKLNLVQFHGVADGPPTTKEFGARVLSSVVVRQSNEYNNKFTTTPVVVISWGSDLNHLRKGDEVFVLGKIGGREKPDKDTGEMRIWNDILCDQIFKLAPAPTEEEKKPVFSAEDIPF